MRTTLRAFVENAKEHVLVAECWEESDPRGYWYLLHLVREWDYEFVYKGGANPADREYILQEYRVLDDAEERIEGFWLACPADTPDSPKITLATMGAFHRRFPGSSPGRYQEAEDDDL